MAGRTRSTATPGSARFTCCRRPDSSSCTRTRADRPGTATRAKWGELDTEDYIKGVDTALARHRDIDSKRVGVSGGSYGGYMTNWLSATTTRFAAAVTSRSITNWESWYGASDAQGLTE